MKRALPMIAVLVFGLPAAANAARSPSQVRSVSSPSADETLREGRRLALLGELDAALATIDAGLERETFPGTPRGALLFLRAALLTDLERREEALTAIEAADANLPGNADVYTLLARLQAANRRFVEASQTVTRLADEFPGNVDSLKGEWMAWLIHNLGDSANDEVRFNLAMALSARNYQGDAAPGEMDWIRSLALQGLLKRNRLDEVPEIASKVVGSTAVLDLLIDARSKPLWPAIEARAGTDLSAQLMVELAANAEAFKREPQNLAFRRGYMHALRINGRFPEALKIGEPIAADLAAIEGAGEDAFWIVNEQALLLEESGRVDESNALFQKLLTLSIERHNGLVSMAINFAEQLLYHGRFDETLQQVAFIENAGERAVSDYGRMWALKAKTCALRNVGRPAEAEKALATMASIQTKNLAAYTSALVCHERFDDAAKVMILRLEREDDRMPMLRAMQTYLPDKRPPVYGKTQSDAMERVMKRPEVRQAVSKYGRILSKVATSEAL